MVMKRTNEPMSATPRSGAGGNGGDLHERIERKAYELFLGRGRQHGHDLEDWLEAERLVLGVRHSQPTPGMRAAAGARPVAGSSRRRVL